MLLGHVFEEVVILFNKVNPFEGVLEEILPDHKKVVLEVALALKLDIAFFVWTHVESFNAIAYHVSLLSAERTLVSQAY